ncbi:protein-glutamate methylesterase/protein-glutamine glutaminase [Paenibacillus sp. DMB20]|uniref:protein-glutamate methylesterase/protein-glutamine glutaminase n=1 Tax=Paenibacillus sp. DMB20 TaxID=1642570 RepID=UPI000627BD30|nr:chemotaxis response regulator protein-glutamate methylesterase [Paenibacillus sp. DMB20]KKO53279.1 chemotaxis protein CheY [Paenibacillus sp. DMB20]
MTPHRVLVVDDSRFMRRIISDLIERDPRFQVVGTANNGTEAVAKCREYDPDIITMDVEMPEMNGLEALKMIMSERPKPVIMLSGINEQGMKETIIALETGAFDFIRKPSISNAQDIEQVGRELVKQLNAAMQAKERRALWEEEEQKRRETAKTIPLSPRPSDRQPRVGPEQNMEIFKKKSSQRKPCVAGTKRNDAVPPSVQAKKDKPSPADKNKENAKVEAGTGTAMRGRVNIEAVKPPSKMKLETSRPVRVSAQEEIPHIRSSRTGSDYDQLVAVGCSTGGPRALKALLESLPADFPAPVVIVQHMPPNFTKSLAQRLHSFSPLNVTEAEHGMILQPGCAYIAPGGSHMTVDRSNTGEYRITLSKGDPCNGHRPSVDVLFESLLPLTELKRHAVLMTGMGGDGARMMKKLYDSGVTSTFAESEETCVVYGMPRTAVELGCVSHILPLQQIAGRLVQAVNNGK